VQPLRVEQFPLEAARDLLGVVRALWLAAKGEDARRAALTSVGLDLVLAIDNAKAMPFANTPQQAAAWFVAERACAALGELLAGDTGDVRPVVEAVMVPFLKRA
jgi:hypothetical protein